MTFVGRILVVVHLILSVFFMAFAGAVFTAHANWMKKAKDADTASSKLKTELAGVRGEMENQKTADNTKLKELEGQVMNLTGERSGLQQRLGILESENKQVKIEVDAQRVATQLSSGETKDRTSEAMLQRDVNSQLYKSRDEVFAELKTAEDKLFAMELQRQQFEEKYAQLLRDSATMRSFLASKDMPTDPKQMLATSQPPTGVEGVILDYRKAEKGSNEFVEISLGSDDDLRIGHTLTVFNNDKYLGQIRLLEVTPDRSVGLVVKKAKNTTIQRGDNVSTKL